jgi:hypothetical protein
MVGIKPVDRSDHRVKGHRPAYVPGPYEREMKVTGDSPVRPERPCEKAVTEMADEVSFGVDAIELINVSFQG